MKKTTKKQVKPAKVRVKKVAEKPRFKDAKAILIAAINGDPPRGLKASFNDAGGVTLSFGKEAMVASKDDVIRAAFKTLNVRFI